MASAALSSSLPAGRDPQRPWAPRPRLITDLLDHAVATFPDRPAIDFLGRGWSYRDVGQMVQRAARGLQAIGLQPGDRIGLCLPNTPYYVVLYFAALQVGAVVVNFNPLYTEREMEYQVRDSGTRMIAVPDLASIHDKVCQVAERTGIERMIVCEMANILPPLKSFGFRVLKRQEHAHYTDDALHVRFSRLINFGGPPEPVEVLPDDVAVLQYTGGTTGVPKGAMLTHNNLTANSAQMLRHMGQVRPVQERTLGVLPMFHVFALTTVLNFSVEIAAEMVLLPRFEMRQMLDTITRKAPTLMFGVPTLFVAINNLPAAQLPNLRGLRACISGGAPLPLDVRHAFEELTGARVVEGYGLSEASPIITCNPVSGEVRDNSCGRAMPGTTIEIRDPEDPERQIGMGGRGEVCARGPQVMKGYWNRPSETAKVFTGEFLRTGDIGYLDEAGYLYLVDRIKDVILCGGYNVYPRIIEDAAYQHPAVQEAIAIGIPDAYRGQSPKLFVKLREGMEATPEELRAFLRDHLNAIELPREVDIREALPKTMVGKLSKKELVEEERQRAADIADCAPS